MNLTKLGYKYTILAALLFVFLLAAPSAWAAPDTSWYVGHESDLVYTLYDADDLAGLAAIVNGTAGLSSAFDFNGRTVNLANDIDLTGYSAGAGWTPIGNSAINSNFAGTFNGGGRQISNMTISLSGERGCGLLQTINNGGRVENVHLVNVSVTNTGGGVWSGGLVGDLDDGTVSGCSVTGIVTGYACTGGLAGATDTAGSIENCTVDVTVNGDIATGGLVGWHLGSVLDSTSFGDVTGGNTTGGLIGANFSGTITNSSATGNVEGADGVGGLVGTNSNNGSIKSSAANGNVKGNEKVGGLVGINSGGSIENGLSGGGVTGNDKVGALVGDNSNGGTINNSQVYDDVTVTDGNGTQTVGNGNIVGDNQNTGGTTGVGIKPRPTAPPASRNPSVPGDPSPSSGRSGGGCDGGLSSAGTATLAGLFMLARRKK